jgi:hypothetical protein
VTDIGPSLLIAASCLVLHWVVITSIAEDFGVLPDVFPARLWRLGNPRQDGHSRMANAVIGGLFGVIVTGLMVVFLFGGGYMTLIGVSELALAGGWLVYLVRSVSREGGR